MRTLIVIPARLESKRLPRKLLLAETGEPLIRHAIAQCGDSRRAAGVVLVTDSNEIGNAAFSMLGHVIFSTGEHPNGTSRVASIAQAVVDNYDAYCIVQADYPEIPPALIDQVIQGLAEHPEWDCATAGVGKFSDMHEYHDVNRVKVMRSVSGVAIDFGRKPPDTPESYWHKSLDKQPTNCLHIGIYCYRREALLKYAAAGPCEREVNESLEQLRALHIGLKMGVVLTDQQVHGIDTRADYDAFVARQSI